MESTPSLSNISYDELNVGERAGPFRVDVTRELAGKLAGEIGEPVEVTEAPPAVFPVLFLHALRQSMGGIPASSILAKQELEFHAPLAVDTPAMITTWTGAKEVKRGRPFVTIEFEIKDENDNLVLTGRKIIVWPTGPGEGEANG